jgi:hypothetical protein
MQNDNKSTFLNRREWGSYLSALQDAATYPSLKGALKSGRDWFTEGAAQATTWLAVQPPLKDKLSTG